MNKILLSNHFRSQLKGLLVVAAACAAAPTLQAGGTPLDPQEATLREVRHRDRLPPVHPQSTPSGASGLPRFPAVGRFGKALFWGMACVGAPAEGARGSGWTGLLDDACAHSLALDLGGQDLPSLLTAQAVNLALDRSNRTGGLPSMEELNQLLTGRGRQTASVLETLPARSEGAFLARALREPTCMEGVHSARGRAGRPLPMPSRTCLSAEMIRTLPSLSPAQVEEAFYLMQIIAHEITLDASRLEDHPELAADLSFFAQELNVLSHELGVFAVQREGNRLDQAFALLQEMGREVVARSERCPRSTSRGEVPLSGMRIHLRVARQALEGVQITRSVSGEEPAQGAPLQGDVEGHLEFTIPGDGAWAPPAGPIQATLTFPNAQGGMTTLNFALAKGGTTLTMAGETTVEGQASAKSDEL